MRANDKLEGSCRLHGLTYIGSCARCNKLSYDQLWQLVISEITEFTNRDHFPAISMAAVVQCIFAMPAVEAYLRDAKEFELRLRKYRVLEHTGRAITQYLLSDKVTKQ